MEVLLRDGTTRDVELRQRRGKKSPPPHPNDPPQLSFVAGYRVVNLGYVVKFGCEHMKKSDACVNHATVRISVCFGTGEIIPYTLCEVCANGLEVWLTPYTNRGSK